MQNTSKISPQVFLKGVCVMMDCKVSVYTSVGAKSGKEYTCVRVLLPNGVICNVFDNNLLLRVYQYQQSLEKKSDK